VTVKLYKKVCKCGRGFEIHDEKATLCPMCHLDSIGLGRKKVWDADKESVK